eukprot:5590627-Amphidinium_carterae.3
MSCLRNMTKGLHGRCQDQGCVVLDAFVLPKDERNLLENNTSREQNGCFFPRMAGTSIVTCAQCNNPPECCVDVYLLSSCLPGVPTEKGDLNHMP